MGNDSRETIMMTLPFFSLVKKAASETQAKYYCALGRASLTQHNPEKKQKHTFFYFFAKKEGKSRSKFFTCFIANDYYIMILLLLETIFSPDC